MTLRRIYGPYTILELGSAANQWWLLFLAVLILAKEYCAIQGLHWASYGYFLRGTTQHPQIVR